MITLPRHSNRQGSGRRPSRYPLAKRFISVQSGSELNHPAVNPLSMSKVKTLSVRLEMDAYKRLCKLADTHKPKLSKNYLMQLAVERLLQLAAQNQLEIVFPTETHE